MEKEALESIKKKVEEVEKKGHGEVIVKIKNGTIYRVLQTFDELMVK